VLELVATGVLADKRVTDHAARCAACRATLDELRDLDALVVKLGPALRDDPTQPCFPRPGDSESGFRIGRELGRGGQSCVFAAVRESTGDDVVLKFLKAGHFATDEHRRRRERELRALASIDDAAVVRLVGHGETSGGLLFTALERVHGETITLHRAWRHSRARLADPRLLSAFLRRFDDLPRALGVVHDAGLIHRDLKPQNILVDQQGQIKIIDFGLSKSMTTSGALGHSAQSLTDEGAFLGTLRYAAPEQFDPRIGAVGPPTDVYAIALLMIELLTGQEPFADVRTAPALVNRLARNAGLRSDALSVIPRPLHGLIRKATSRNPARRHQSARRFRADLHRVIRRLEATPVHSRGYVGSVRRVLSGLNRVSVVLRSAF